MRRTLIALSTLLLLACQPPAKNQPEQAKANEQAKPVEAKREPKQVPPPTKAQVVRKDLLAEALPPVPTLEQLDATVVASGELAFPDGTNELAPRAALALRDGLLLAGQAYLDRRPGAPSQSWRWAGFIPRDGEPRSTRTDPGAIRAGIVLDDGQGLLTGTRGIGYDARGWFAKVTADGTIVDETPLDTANSTELFDLLPGRAEGELVVLGGYVDAQGWLLSLDANGQRRWEKYLGSYGNTQVRALARLDSGELLAIGSRAEKFGEAWSARAPGDGGSSAAADDVTQSKLEIAGADPNRMLRVLVELGEAGYVAFGTAKLQHIQAHDQLFAVGIDRKGELAWSRVIEGVRVTDVLGARARDGVAQLIVTVPLGDEPQPETALALVSVPADASAAVLARRLADASGWSSAGFVEGSDTLELVGYKASDLGITWRRLTI